MGEPPPLVGVAVNVTLVPAHIGPAGFATTVTDGVTTGLNVMFIMLDGALAGLAHAAFDVIITCTWSPATSVDVEYVGLFVPTLLPFTFHW